MSLAKWHQRPQAVLPIRKRHRPKRTYRSNVHMTDGVQNTNNRTWPERPDRIAINSTCRISPFANASTDATGMMFGRKSTVCVALAGFVHCWMDLIRAWLHWHQLGIPAKANTDSEGNANSISGPKTNSARSVATLALRLCSKCSASSRKTYRELSGAQRRKRAGSGERGAGKGAAALFPAQHCRDPGERQLDGSVPRFLRMESPRISRRCAL